MKTSYKEIVNATNIGKKTDADQLISIIKGFAQQSLHVIDIQRDFFDEGALAVASDVERFISTQKHEKYGEEELRIWPDHCIAGTTDHML